MSTTALWRSLRTSWWVIALGAVIGALLGAAALLVLPTSYASSASVLVTAAPADPATTEDTLEFARRRLPNVVEMAGSDESSAQIAAAAGIDASAVETSVSYEIPDETTVIVVTGTGDSAESAQALADAASARLVEHAGDFSTPGMTMTGEALKKADIGSVSFPSTPLTIATGLLLGALVGLLVGLVRGARRFGDAGSEPPAPATPRSPGAIDGHGAHRA